MKRRSGFAVMARLIGLVRPLAGYMVLAIAMGLAGHLCAAFITDPGRLCRAGRCWASQRASRSRRLFVCVLALRARCAACLRYAEQACNHFIAFKLLALIRDKVFRALRRLCPAKLEGRDRGDLIAVITSDIELLEVFYAHTISPVGHRGAVHASSCALFIGAFHALLAALGAGGLRLRRRGDPARASPAARGDTRAAVPHGSRASWRPLCWTACAA